MHYTRPMLNIEPSEDVAREWLPAMLRGWSARCPVCGNRTLFTAYLKMAPACRDCATDFQSYRADDAPAYFVIFIVGHIVIPLVLVLEKLYEPALWIHAVLWLPLCVGLCLWLLPRVKGAVFGLLWALRVSSPRPV